MTQTHRQTQSIATGGRPRTLAQPPSLARPPTWSQRGAREQRTEATRGDGRGCLRMRVRRCDRAFAMRRRPGTRSPGPVPAQRLRSRLRELVLAHGRFRPSSHAWTSLSAPMQVPRGLETALTLERTTPGDKLVRETCALSLSSPAWDTPMWSVPDKSPFCALVVPGVDVGDDLQPGGGAPGGHPRPIPY